MRGPQVGLHSEFSVDVGSDCLAGQMFGRTELAMCPRLRHSSLQVIDHVPLCSSNPTVRNRRVRIRLRAALPDDHESPVAHDGYGYEPFRASLPVWHRFPRTTDLRCHRARQRHEIQVRASPVRPADLRRGARRVDLLGGVGTGRGNAVVVLGQRFHTDAIASANHVEEQVCGDAVQPALESSG